MDKHDEQERPAQPRDTREGDVLGLSGITVPKTATDPSTEYDPESVRRRRERAAGADDVAPAADEDGHGATGIDMGAGGGGTDVSGH